MQTQSKQKPGRNFLKRAVDRIRWSHNSGWTFNDWVAAYYRTSKNDGNLPRIVEKMKQTGTHYDWLCLDETLADNDPLKPITFSQLKAFTES